MHCIRQWASGILHCTAALNGAWGGGQLVSFVATLQCMGQWTVDVQRAEGSGYPSVHCDTTWGRGHWAVSFPQWTATHARNGNSSSSWLQVLC